MAQLVGLQRYDRTLRKDMEELQNNLWPGAPVSGQKAGNLRAVYLAIDLTGVTAGTTFGIKHSLGETPLGYEVVGTPSSSIVVLEPGESGGTRIPWTATRVYLKAPAATNVTVMIRLWGSDSGGE